jgi:hypothetical protein
MKLNKHFTWNRDDQWVGYVKTVIS